MSAWGEENQSHYRLEIFSETTACRHFKFGSDPKVFFLPSCSHPKKLTVGKKNNAQEFYDLKCTHQPRPIGLPTCAAKFWLITQRVHMPVEQDRSNNADNNEPNR